MFLKKYLSVNGTTLKEFPFLKELAMEAFLIENEDVLAFPQFEAVSIEGYELKITDGGIAGDKNGRLDILASYGSDYAAVIELKAEEINECHVAQLSGYLAQRSQLEAILAKNQDSDANPDEGGTSNQKFDSKKKWLGVLVGTSIDPDFARDLRKKPIDILVGMDKVPIIGMTLKRYRDEVGQVYVITDLFMPEIVEGKDYTKYEFEGKLYTKGKLVLAVVRSYLQRNPSANYDLLKLKFPADLRGGTGVFMSKDDAESIVQRTEIARHFVKPGETLMTGDKVSIAISSQWGKGNIKKFICWAINELKFDIKAVEN